MTKSLKFRGALPFLIGGALAVGCNDPLPGQVGSPCPNDNNCIGALRCIDGTCQMGDAPDAGTPDTGAPDTGAPDTGAPDAGPMYADEFNSGSFTVTPDGMMFGYDQLTGRVGMMREETGYTSVLVNVTGLNPITEYSVHVHQKSCTDEAGGLHYQIDPDVMDVLETNEIWPVVETDMDGAGYGYKRVNHFTRDDAKAVVIHEPMTGERIACANLSPNGDATANGTFYELAAGMGSGITGTASLRRYRSGTVATVMIEGMLNAGAIYPVHVHAQRCDDAEGGPHYKIDATIMGTEEGNEIWPNVEVAANGMMGTGEAQTPHIARYDAWSMVVHDPDTNDRLLCADLRW